MSKMSPGTFRRLLRAGAGRPSCLARRMRHTLMARGQACTRSCHCQHHAVAASEPPCPATREMPRRVGHSCCPRRPVLVCPRPVGPAPLGRSPASGVAAAATLVPASWGPRGAAPSPCISRHLRQPGVSKNQLGVLATLLIRALRSVGLDRLRGRLTLRRCRSAAWKEVTGRRWKPTWNGAPWGYGPRVGRVALEVCLP